MQERRIHRLFQLSVLAKGAHAAAELAGGAALALFSTDSIARLLYRFGSSDWAVRVFPSEHHYYTFYLLSHGAVNLALVVGLLREKHWAYPATLAVLGLFIAYQLYRFAHVRDPGLIVLSLLDLIVMALAWHEWRLLRSRLPNR